MAEVEIAAPRRSYEIVSDSERPWILPELWKTPGRSEIDPSLILAFSTTPWTGYARPQAPPPRQLLISLDTKVRYDPMHRTR